MLGIVVEFFFIVGFCCVHQCLARNKLSNEVSTTLRVNATAGSGRQMPATLFGVFFEVQNSIHLNVTNCMQYYNVLVYSKINRNL